MSATNTINEHNNYEFEKLDDLIRESFELDALGIFLNLRVKTEDKRALSILNELSKREKNEWHIGLLWKNENMVFPNSRANALNRLKLLERKFDRDKEYATMHIREMNGFIENGFAEKISEPPSNKIWYLPYFGVQNINKPGKVRIVFDAAAKNNSTSFNDLLLTGPDLLKNLLGVLMRFRQERVAFKGDVKDMLLKIKVRR